MMFGRSPLLYLMDIFAMQLVILGVYIDAFVNRTRKELLDTLTNNSLYNKKVPPSYEEGSSTIVRVEMFVISLDSVSETSMDYEMSFFLRQKWVDNRLTYTPLKDSESVLELDSLAMTEIWVPDLYILSEKFARFHDVTVPNKLMHIYPNGTVQYSLRVTGTFSCPMELKKYPFDEQVCVMDFESYAFSNVTVTFRWHCSEVAINTSKALKLAQFDLVEATGTICDKKYYGNAYSNSTITFRWQNATGPAINTSKALKLAQFTISEVEHRVCDKKYYGIYYSCIQAKFKLARRYGFFIIQIYVPSVLIVVLSWINFWIDCEAVPARISLGLLTVLTMTTQTSGTQVDLPEVSYVKAIDVWLSTCLAFVFASFVEFAYVNVLSRKQKRKLEYSRSFSLVQRSDSEKGQSRNDSVKQGVPSEQKNGAARATLGKMIEKPKPSFCSCCKTCSNYYLFRNLVGKEKARVVDKISRATFPLSFLIFNIVYWIYYLHIVPNPEESVGF